MSRFPNKLRCRFCGYETRAYWRTKGGAVHTGWRTLAHHVADWHPAEYEPLYVADLDFGESLETYGLDYSEPFAGIA